MTDMLNTTSTIISKLTYLHNVTNINANILIACHNEFKSLKNSIAQKSSDTYDGTISNLDKCFNYFSDLHNKFASTGNTLSEGIYKHFDILREEKKEIHTLLCKKELKESEDSLKEAEERKDSLKLSLVNQEGDNLDAAKDYYNAILKLNYVNATFISTQKKCINTINIEENNNDTLSKTSNITSDNTDSIYTESNDTTTLYDNSTMLNDTYTAEIFTT